LYGYPVFPPGTKSLLSKYLTREVWNELKNSEDSHGFSFKQAIFSGSKNTDSGIGVYAGSHNSYEAFAPLFDEII
jgi:arginine kinase